jgi:hypothetical protein
MILLSSPPRRGQRHYRQPNGRVGRKRVEVFSPPFEGGVAGMTDYLDFTKLISRPGWLILSFSVTELYSSNLNIKKCGNEVVNEKEEMIQ